MKRISPATALSVLLLAAALPVLATDTLAVKTGLWETTTVTSNTGMTLPAEAMANMPPAQRAQMEAMVSKMASRAPKTFTAKSCITAEDLKEGAFKAAREGQEQNCKYTVIKATAKHQDLEMTCSGKADVKGHMTVDAVDNGNVHGEIDMKMPQMTMNVKFTSRWLATSCAGADKD